MGLPLSHPIPSHFMPNLMYLGFIRVYLGLILCGPVGLKTIDNGFNAWTLLPLGFRARKVYKSQGLGLARHKMGPA